VFSKFDNSNNYYLTINSDGTVSVGTLSGNYDLDAEFENHSADNAESTVLPLNKITIDYEGEDVKDARLTYDYFSKAAGTILVSGWSMAKCTNRDGCLTSDQLISNPVINSDGRTSPSYGTAFIACGTDQLTEQILCQGPSYSPNNLFKWIVPDWCGRGGRIKFKVLSGWNIALGGDAGDPGLAVYLTCGSYNYNFNNNGWGSTSYAKQISGNGDFEISFTAPPIEAPLVMEVYCTSRLSSEVVISIQNLRIEANDSLVGAYLDISRDLKRVIQGTPSPEEGSIDATLGRAFSQYSNYVNASGNIGQNPQYNYLKTSQNRLVISGALMSSGSPTALLSPYLRKTTFWKSEWKWKIIAIAFEPREDLWTITMHHSTVND
jgi:hypothetical protein